MTKNYLARLKSGTDSCRILACCLPVLLCAAAPGSPEIGAVDVSVSPDHVQPGDPTIVVEAPPGTTGVTAYLPFGSILDLSYDRELDCWTGRFLVPNDVSDGVYAILVAISTADGDVIHEEVRFRVDSEAPYVQVQLQPGSRIELGEVLIIEVLQHPAIEQTVDISGHDRIQFIRLHLPDGRVVRMLPSTTRAGVWTYWYRHGDALGAGSFTAMVESVDLASNTRFTTVEYQVFESAPAHSKLKPANAENRGEFGDFSPPADRISPGFVDNQPLSLE